MQPCKITLWFVSWFCVLNWRWQTSHGSRSSGLVECIFLCTLRIPFVFTFNPQRSHWKFRAAVCTWLTWESKLAFRENILSQSSHLKDRIWKIFVNYSVLLVSDFKYLSHFLVHVLYVLTKTENTGITSLTVVTSMYEFLFIRQMRMPMSRKMTRFFERLSTITFKFSLFLIFITLVS